MDEFKEVTVTIKMRVKDDQPVSDWILNAIETNLLNDGEEIIEYSDDEPIVK